jgi:hypothetical protein
MRLIRKPQDPFFTEQKRDAFVKVWNFFIVTPPHAEEEEEKLFTIEANVMLCFFWG